MALEQLAHQSLDRRGAAPTLDPDIQHGAVLTYGSPEPVLHAADRHHHLVNVAFVLRIGAAPGSAGRSTDQTWWPGIVPSRRSDQGPGYQHFLHHAQPERKWVIQPCSVVDQVGEALALERDRQIKMGREGMDGLVRALL